MKAVVAAFNQEKTLVGAFSVITNFRMELFGALYLQSICADDECCCYLCWVSRGEVIKSVVPQFPGRHYDYPPHPLYPGPSHHHH